MRAESSPLALAMPAASDATLFGDGEEEWDVTGVASRAPTRNHPSGPRRFGKACVATSTDLCSPSNQSSVSLTPGARASMGAGVPGV